MAYGFDEGKNKVNFADYFTYVIDSQAKFDDWVNGVSGNDYSYVAIIGGKGSGTNGAYIQTISNDLTNKTKGIQGFCGARIEANSNRGLEYNPRPTGTDYFVSDLDVTVEGTGSNVGFYQCINLTNCTGKGTELNGVGIAIGFQSCTNLINCTGYGYNYVLDNTSADSKGFDACRNLINCKGYGYGTGGVRQNLFGFYDCTRLSFCTATGATAKYYNCYVTSTANETYKIPENGSDTPNGGFNV